MSLDTQIIERLTSDNQTSEEAKNLIRLARANTGVGSGFDLGEDRTGLAAVCTYLASQKLNNTNVTFEAAQAASCQNKNKFKKLHDLVAKALVTAKPARRKPLNYKNLLLEHCSQITQTAVPWMDKIEARVWEKVDDDEELVDDEVTCAVFIWVCNAIKPRLFHPKSFEDKYETDTARMRRLNSIINTVCPLDAEKIQKAYNEATESAQRASVSPRKSPTKPALRTLPSRDSPQKRKVIFHGDEEDADVPESPTKRRKAEPSASLVTLESIRAMAASPSKLPLTPSTPRKALRLSTSPSKSPVKKVVPGTPDVGALSSDEEDYEPPPGRRFRPVFRDQQQWAMCDPRLAKLTKDAVEFHKGMVRLHGLPFEDARRDLDAMDSD
ncbi:hypothetical protein K438DRAFT_2011847 [Mycena galopus ATCC 62051]|nr:hypothetical protein K438DRAFT_2011847 [Mycena galopus ATCC 62051]